MQEYLDQVKVEDLPQSLRDVAEIVGLNAALQIMKTYPGRRFFVPARGFAAKHPLQECMSDEERRCLCAHFAGAIMVVPVGRKALQAVRDRLICEDRAAGCTVEKLSIKYKLCERRIGEILAAARKAAASPPVKAEPKVRVVQLDLHLLES